MKLFRILVVVVISFGLIPVITWAKTVDVSITNDGFSPATLLVNKGDTVRWTNTGTTLHSATSGTATDGPDGYFDSGQLNPGVSYEHTFTAFGTIHYFDYGSSTASGTLKVGGNYVVISPSSSLLHPDQSFDLVIFLYGDSSSSTTITLDGKQIYKGDFMTLVELTDTYHILYIPVGAFVAAIPVKPNTFSPGVHDLTVDVTTPAGDHLSDTAIYTVAEPAGGVLSSKANAR